MTTQIIMSSDTSTATDASRFASVPTQPRDWPPYSTSIHTTMATVKLTEYERNRLKRIEENRQRIIGLFGGKDPCSHLGLTVTVTCTKSTSKKRKARKEPESSVTPVDKTSDSDEENEERPAKVSRQDKDNAPETGNVRRSSRLSGKKVDYNAEQDRSTRTFVDSKRHKATMGSEPRIENKRTHNPYVSLLFSHLSILIPFT